MKKILLTSHAITILLLTIIMYNPNYYNHSKNYNDHVHKTLFLDRTFSKEEVEFITSAAIEWSEATQHIANIDIVQLSNKEEILSKDSVIVVAVSPDYPDVLIDESLSNNTILGLYTRKYEIGIIELVVSRISDEDYKTVVMHELGHALGLDHNLGLDGIFTLMSPSIDGCSNHITQKDLDNFCQFYHCNLKLSQH